MEILDAARKDIDIEAELDALARRYRRAGGLGVQLLNMIGGGAESLIDRLPVAVRRRLEDGTVKALGVAVRAANSSRGVLGDQPMWLNTAAATAMGAAGGFGGLPSALAELPVTITVLFRAIQGAAAEHGFDPAEQGVMFDCLQVFSAAGPLEADDGADLAFLSTRVALTGGAIQGLIARIAPKLAVVLGQKLAAQTVPVLGAVAGAATNYAYTSYYQEVAHVHFRLRRLAIETDSDRDTLVAGLRERLAVPPMRQG